MRTDRIRTAGAPKTYILVIRELTLPKARKAIYYRLQARRTFEGHRPSAACCSAPEGADVLPGKCRPASTRALGLRSRPGDSSLP